MYSAISIANKAVEYALGKGMAITCEDLIRLMNVIGSHVPYRTDERGFIKPYRVYGEKPIERPAKALEKSEEPIKPKHTKEIEKAVDKYRR